MKLTKNTKMIVLGLGLLLGFILTNFRPSGSRPAAPAKSVSLLDISGRPLSSVFERLPADPLYPEFKRLSEKRSLTCDRRSNSWSRFRTMLGLSFESVVHAQTSCGDCGYQVVYTANCSSDCGGNPYDGNLQPTSPSGGITTGPTRCQTSSSACPGTTPTVDCTCGSGGGGCMPDYTPCYLSEECCSGFCDPSSYVCNHIE